MYTRALTHGEVGCCRGARWLRVIPLTCRKVMPSQWSGSVGPPYTDRRSSSRPSPSGSSKPSGSQSALVGRSILGLLTSWSLCINGPYGLCTHALWNSMNICPLSCGRKWRHGFKSLG